PRYAEAAPVLVKALRHADADVRWQATWELGQFSHDYGAMLRNQPHGYELAKAALYHNLEDPDTLVRAGTAFALAAWHDDPDKLVPLLAGRLSDSNTPRQERLTIMRALANLGPDAKLAV